MPDTDLDLEGPRLPSDDDPHIPRDSTAWRVLLRTPSPKWRFLGLVVDHDDGSCEVFHRPQMVAWARSHDLPADIIAQLHRRVPERSVIALIIGGGRDPRVHVIRDPDAPPLPARR